MTSMLEDLYDTLFVDGPSRKQREEWSNDTSPEATMLNGQAMGEVHDETGIPMSQIGAHDPYDPRWGDVWARSYEIRQAENGGEGPHNPAHDQQAFKEIFGE